MAFKILENRARAKHEIKTKDELEFIKHAQRIRKEWNEEDRLEKKARHKKNKGYSALWPEDQYEGES